MYSLNKYGIFSLSSCLAEETQAGDVAAAVRRRRAPQKDAALGEGGERGGGGLSGRGLAAETRRERLANAGAYGRDASAHSKDDQGTEWLEQGGLE